MRKHSSPITVSVPIPFPRWTVTFSLKVTLFPILTQLSSSLKLKSCGSPPTVTFS